jgi:DNA-binding NarL/FixJ family response regulator
MTDRARDRSRVLVVEKDLWRKESLVSFLAERGFQVVETEPDVLLVNLCRRSSEASEVVRALKADWPEARVVAFVNEIGAHTVFPCLVLSVNGVLAVDAGKEELVAALRAVLVGSLWVPRELLAGWVQQVVKQGLRGVPFEIPAPSGVADVFTRSEWKVLKALDLDFSNKEIAKACGVSESTVKFHIGKLLRKTGARDRRGLTRMYREMAGDTRRASQDHAEA